MKIKFFATVLMATVLLMQCGYTQTTNIKPKLKANDNQVFFGKKSYNYKSFGKQSFEDNLKQAKERFKSLSSKNKTSHNFRPGSKKLDFSSNFKRKGKSYYGRKGNGYDRDDTYYYPERNFNPDRYYGFSSRDFGYANSFNPNLERADQITENMDRVLDLSRGQAYDVFRLNVLFISDMSQLMYGSNAYAYGASYGQQYMDYHLRDLITENYLNALEEILKNSQERRLDDYFRRYDLMGNSVYSRYDDYNSYNNYGRCD